jgi:hypothetical protein
MLEFYVSRHKRWKDRARTKRRRRQINTVPDCGQREEWGPRYITNVSRSSRRLMVIPISRYQRYLNSNLGKDVGDVYSELSRVRMYRGNGRHDIKRWFSNDLQWGQEYRRGEDNCLELAPAPKEKPIRQLEGRIVNRDGWLMARVYVWCPYSYSGKVIVTGIEDLYGKQSTPYLHGKGWWGLYVEEYPEYKYELVTDSKGRPLFTKEEYQIKVTDTHYHASITYRTIPAGGPLLRETMCMVTRYDWKMVPDWEVRLCNLKQWSEYV